MKLRINIIYIATLSVLLIVFLALFTSITEQDLKTLVSFLLGSLATVMKDLINPVGSRDAAPEPKPEPCKDNTPEPDELNI